MNINRLHNLKAKWDILVYEVLDRLKKIRAQEKELQKIFGPHSMFVFITIANEFSYRTGSKINIPMKSSRIKKLVIK